MFRKGISILLAFSVVLFTVLAILGIWEIIDIKNFAWKSFSSIMVIFVSAAILLFIFSVLYKNEDDEIPPSNNQP
ncbi:MAG: hypothetical protein J5I47_06590 [Vicingus serpentipes]|nr:hypothetical protein [Vicingus serpentipes]